MAWHRHKCVERHHVRFRRQKRRHFIIFVYPLNFIPIDVAVSDKTVCDRCRINYSSLQKQCINNGRRRRPKDCVSKASEFNCSCLKAILDGMEWLLCFEGTNHLQAVPNKKKGHSWYKMDTKFKFCAERECLVYITEMFLLIMVEVLYYTHRTSQILRYCKSIWLRMCPDGLVIRALESWRLSFKWEQWNLYRD